MDKVLVIIVSYNGEQWIERCVGSALFSDIKPDVMVIDNASDDRTVQMLEEMEYSYKTKGLGLHVTYSPNNLGFGAANNIGFEYALEHGYDYVYLLNQDAYLEPGTISKLVDVHKWNPWLGILSPVQLDAEGKADRQFAKRTGIRKTSKLDVPIKVKFVMAAHWLIPVAVLKKVGGFSPTFHHYGEDDNWVDRLHYHKFGIAVITSVSAIHDRAKRTQSKENRCRRKCLIPVIRMSRPQHRWSFARSAMWLIGCSIRNFSLIPVKSIPELWARRSEINKNRESSMADGAFLSHRS